MDADKTIDKQTEASDWTRVRTALALDRTLLAWIRTALTLIGFGFTLAKFVHELIEKGDLHVAHPGYPRQIGFALMGLGIATLIGGSFEYINMGRKLQVRGSVRSVSIILALSLIILAVLFTINVLFELKSL